MNINERIESLKIEFSKFSDWEDRYRQLINMGKDLAPLEEEFKVEKFKVKGCQSQVWLNATLVEDKVIFHADSDASIAKGIVALLINIYSNSTPDEIIITKTDFLDELGLKQHLSMNRANGLASMLKQIQMYAVAFQVKMKMGI